MRGEHFVVGGDDGDVGGVHHPQALLVFRTARRDTVSKVGALEFAAHRAFAGCAANQLKIALAGITTASDQPLGYLKNAGMHVMNSRLTSMVTRKDGSDDRVRMLSRKGLVSINGACLSGL